MLSTYRIFIIDIRLFMFPFNIIFPSNSVTPTLFRPSILSGIILCKFLHPPRTSLISLTFSLSFYYNQTCLCREGGYKRNFPCKQQPCGTRELLFLFIFVFPISFHGHMNFSRCYVVICDPFIPSAVQWITCPPVTCSSLVHLTRPSS